MRSPEQYKKNKIRIMVNCFECYCENGLGTTGIKTLAPACGMTSENLYAYFNNIDELIIESTTYCMAKVEDEFMALAQKDISDIKRFLMRSQMGMIWKMYLLHKGKVKEGETGR
ncbi:MAG: TetR/AcrR family transcriptional regulator [Oscillospiraceae bacterium]|nr:TetR/AcrR family transcriptional regulator [Oscillospiraceae bacterium]